MMAQESGLLFSLKDAISNVLGAAILKQFTIIQRSILTKEHVNIL
jgi:hypothetical protein